MSSCIGPNKYLPGEHIKCDPGHVCDCEGCGLPAKHAIVGETDSFGSEILHFCEAHYQQFTVELAQEKEENPPECEFCKSTERVAFTRDPSEGMSGPLYELCAKCRRILTDSFLGDDEY